MRGERWRPKVGDRASIYVPSKWRGRRLPEPVAEPSGLIVQRERIRVEVVPDLFSPGIPASHVDRVFAMMASCGMLVFALSTAHPWRLLAYLERVRRGAPKAWNKYNRELDRHHRTTYIADGRDFRHRLVDPPTPELRFIYDSAARQEPKKPATGTHLYRRNPPHFEAGECHWREWPLNNVKISPRAKGATRG